MQAPHEFPSHLWTPLLRLWRRLADEPQLPLLDRWFKQQLRQLPRELTQADQLDLGKLLREAMVYLQLAAALEAAYQQQLVHQEPAEELDWNHWDQQWSPAQSTRLPTAVFCHWLALRLGMDEKPLRLDDKNQRRTFFSEFAAAAQAAPILSPLGLLWQGLRPQWLEPLQERAATSGWSQAQLTQFVQLQASAPPLWLRPQQGQTPAGLVALLLSQGVNAQCNAQGQVFAQGGRGLASTQAYQQGLVEIQDLASQQIAAAVAARPGQKVWDACAGAGGKTLAIAQPMNNKGVVVATDLYDYKLDEVKRRAKRAGLFNIRTFTWAGDAPLRLPREVAQQQGFDWVLVDAPCSSAGTWRRNPDARWRLSQGDTAELIQIQQRLLALAAQSVRCGGQLVYATCSWQRLENEAQVAQFLHLHPEFVLQRAQMLGAPQEDADSMFVAVMQRRLSGS